MAVEWFYKENGKVLGPVSGEEIVVRLRKGEDPPRSMWRADSSEWTEDSGLSQSKEPSLSPAEVPCKPKPPVKREHETLAGRAEHELTAYLAVSAYLLAWFSAVMFYKAVILRGIGIEFAPFGFAAMKALILGKFILVLEALKVGEGRDKGGILALQILWRALLFTLLLFLLSIAEDIIVGYFHGREMREVLHQVGGGSILEAFAEGVLMFLVLVPYLAFRRIAVSLGELPELLFSRRLP